MSGADTSQTTDPEGHKAIIYALCGATNPRRVFRKWYVASRSSDQERLMDRLCREGRMVSFPDAFDPDSTLRCFHVTEKGAASVGLYLP